jgi:NTE family protein
MPDAPANHEERVLVLQGGGALGAYQGGVFQALQEARLEPDWVAGISIGAINSALIAGNPPERRVRGSANSGKRSARHCPAVS